MDVSIGYVYYQALRPIYTMESTVKDLDMLLVTLANRLRQIVYGVLHGVNPVLVQEERKLSIVSAVSYSDRYSQGFSASFFSISITTYQSMKKSHTCEGSLWMNQV